jgi:hypothetical protein
MPQPSPLSSVAPIEAELLPSTLSPPGAAHPLRLRILELFEAPHHQASGRAARRAPTRLYSPWRRSAGGAALLRERRAIAGRSRSGYETIARQIGIPEGSRPDAGRNARGMRRRRRCSNRHDRSATPFRRVKERSLLVRLVVVAPGEGCLRSEAHASTGRPEPNGNTAATRRQGSPRTPSGGRSPLPSRRFGRPQREEGSFSELSTTARAADRMFRGAAAAGERSGAWPTQELGFYFPDIQPRAEPLISLQF